MNPNPDKDIFTAGFHFDSTTGEITAKQASSGSESIKLSPVNARVLAALLLAQGKAVTRTALFSQVWPNQEVSDDALTRSISDLRAQLKPLANTSPLIATIPKVGYRWLPATGEQTKQTATENTWRQHLVPLFSALIILLLMLLMLLAFLSLKAQKNTTNVVILPSQNLAGNQVVNCLKDASNANDAVRYLADHAFASYPGNPYPFFSLEFGVDWFIDSQLEQSKGTNEATFTLIDARTGLVMRNEKHSYKDKMQLAQHCQNIIKNLTE